MEKFLWNQLDLDPPPSMCVQLQSPYPAELRNSLSSMCAEAKQFLLSKQFRAEATFISRTLHRYKNQFRCIKGFKFLRKINQALLRVPKLNLKDVFNELASCISDEFVPSFQMVEFSMLRMQSLAFLLARLICTCEELFLMLKSYMMAPGPWDIWLTFQACISRVWVLSHHLLQKTDKWYELMFCLHSISDQTESWLPSSYSLPDNLLSWVNQQLIENGLSPAVTVNTYHRAAIKLENVEATQSIQNVPSKPSIEEIPVGEMFSAFSEPKKGKKKKRGTRKGQVRQKAKSSESADIQSLGQLRQFLDTEVELRNRSDTKKICITKNLDPVEWDILKTILMKSIEKITKKPSAAEKILSKVRQTLQVAVS